LRRPEGSCRYVSLRKKDEEVSMKKALASMVLGTALLLAGAAQATKPAQNVSPKRHPNLAAAQNLSAQAFEKIGAAQKANEWDMQGHAAKAKELLEQVNHELKLAAEAANANAPK
jgi:PBP1b-binding outer membrane lipoprotein LpoB